MLEGSCLCGTVRFRLLDLPVSVTNCHCTMCQKQHGAPFATYMTLKKQHLIYLSGEDQLSSYNSSSTILRKFCSTCGSNIEWGGHPDYLEWVSLPLTLLNNPITPEKVENIFAETKCSWV